MILSHLLVKALHGRHAMSTVTHQGNVGNIALPSVIHVFFLTDS